MKMSCLVNTALTEVPVNKFPLKDSTDFVTTETAVAYNASGMALYWNFFATDGSFTRTQVTPAASGNYLWTHQGGGIYTIQIPASGGASINNNAAGTGFFTGDATGVMSWVGPEITFAPATVINSLVNGTDVLPVDVTQFNGTNGTFSGGRPEVNASHVGGSAISQSGGVLNTNVSQFGGVGGTFSGGRPEVNTTHESGNALVGGTGALHTRNIVDRGTAQAATSTTLQLRSALALGNDVLIGATVYIDSATTAGAGQQAVVIDFDSATDTITVSPAFGTTPSGTITYILFGGPRAPTDSSVLPSVAVASIANNALTAAAAATDLITEIQSGLATASSVSTLTSYVDTEVAAVKAVTDKLDTALELDGAVYRYTTNALENGPSGGGGTADWTADERTAIRSILGIPGSGTTPADPSTGILDTIRGAVAGVQSDTNDIQTRLPATLVSGRMDASVGAMASSVLTAAALATDAVAEIVDAVFDEALSGHTTAGSAGWSLQLSGEVIDDTTITGTPSSTQIQLTAGSAVDDFYNDQLLYIVSGTGVGQARPILDYVGATKTITVDEPFVTTPASGARVIIRSTHVHAKSQIAASVWADSAATTLIGNIGDIETDTTDIQSRLPAALVSGRIDASVGAMATDVITSTALAASAVTEIQSGLATASALSTLDDFVDTEVAAIKAVTDKLDTALEIDGAVYKYTINALENAPSGGGGGTTDWTANERDAIRAILGVPASGTTPDDPTTGILDTIRDAVAGLNDLSSGDVQTAVGTALGTYDAATGTDVTSATSGLATAAALATVNTVVDTILLDTNDIQTRLPAALVSGRIDASVGAMATDVITSGALAASAVTEIQSGLATASALSTLDDFVDTEVAAIKAKTDQLVFTKANELDVNVQSANGVTLVGDGVTTPIGAA